MTKMRDSMPVVFAVLAGIFLLMIIFQWGGQGTIFEPKGEAGTLGLVNGYPITQKDYNKIYETVTNEMKTKNKETNLNESDEDDASDKAWDQAVSQAIEDHSIEQMGLTVTDQEIRDVLFYNPPADVKKTFTDSMGHYHQDWYIKALRDPRNDSITRSMEADARGQIRHMKWQQAMAATIRVTDTEAFLHYMTDSAKAILQVIKIPAPEVTPQMEHQVSEKDIQSYYDSHTWLYHQDEQRKLQFVRFPLVPNGRDTALVMETANGLKARLAEVPYSKTDTATIDTVAKELAQDYSDAPYSPHRLVTMRELGNDTSLLSAKAGDAAVVTIQGKITVLRVLDVFDTSSHTLFRVRHISIGYPLGVAVPTPQMKDSVLAVANQVLQQLKNGADFAELARTRSMDPRTAGKGGDMGWEDTAIFPLTFRPLIGSATNGELIGPLESPRGFDILQVMMHTRTVWGIVSLSLVVKPSHQTLELESQMANIFREQAQKIGFDKAASAAGYHVIANAPPVSRKGAPIFSSHLFVDWVFEANKDDISTPLKLLKSGSIIVSQLTQIIPAGPKPLADVKSQIAQDLALRKAVDALAPRAQQVRAAIGSGDLSVAATSMADPSLAPITVLMGPAESVNGLPTSEYAINNWAFSAEPGTVSPPLKGEHGYYIVKLMGRTIPTEKEFEAAKPQIVKQVLQEKEQRVLMDWIDNQKQHATIEDYRFKR